MSKPLRVLVIDDSASVRQAMTAILSADPEIEVIAAAADPFAAARYIHEEVPDVITLDVEMPRMGGVDLVRALRKSLPDLKVLYLGGEALPADLADRWARGRRLVNGYGPTECAVTALRCDIQPEIGRAHV